MRGDFSRDSFDRGRHAHAVLMQQGRVQLDADWNELQAVQAYRAETQAVDVIGASGTPRSGTGFRIDRDAQGAPTVGTGRFYLDGLLAENDATVPLTGQPHLPGYQLPSAPGCYLAYLDVRLREITALDDGSIREVALGGPDTAIRAAVVWQVKLLRVGPHDPAATCASIVVPEGVFAAPAGTLRARARRDAPGDKPCSIAPEARFSGVENQLYRVEIHQGGGTGTATFKWSRDNGAVLAGWRDEDVGAQRIRIDGIGRDGMPVFAKDQWVELLDDTNDLYDDTAPGHDAVDPAGRPGTLIALNAPVEDGILELAAVPPPRGAHNPRVRGWDMGRTAIGVAETSTPDGYIDLENGVQVRFDQDATYRAGDYWLIPARTVTADIEWPGTPEAPGAKPPDGVRRHVARLAVLTTADGAAWQVLDDCRDPFPALTDLQAADVGFDNTGNDLPGAVTVQDALDVLSDRQNLKKHNQALHGWGVVHGLQLTCGPNDPGPRRNVTLHPGYAIDADGNDLDVDAAFRLDALGMAESLGVLTDGAGDVELLLDPALDPPVRPRKHVPPGRDDPPPIDGTLLWDFWTTSIEPLKKWLDEQLTGDPNTPADPARQRYSVLLNLANQAVNPRSGQQVFLSQREDKIIREFYNGLRSRLTSATFCAMFEGARELDVPYPFPKIPPPPNPPAADMDVIFGTGGHDRMRLRPGGDEVYTFGSGIDPRKPKPKINRYDLRAGALLAEIDPVAGTQRVDSRAADDTDTGTGPVLDIAFSRTGDRIHVAIASRSEDNTIFRSGTISADGIAWNSKTTICGFKLVSLITVTGDPGAVYAVALRKEKVTTQGKVTSTRFEWRGAALLRINPDQIDPGNVPRVVLDDPNGEVLVPTGPAVAAGGTVIVLGCAAATRDATANYTHLTAVQVPPPAQGTARLWSRRLDLGTGTGPLATQAQRGLTSRVWAVCEPPDTSGRFLAGFAVGTGEPLPRGTGTIDDGAAAITVTPNAAVMVAEMNTNAIRAFGTRGNAFAETYSTPTQVAPAAIVTRDDGGVVVLNQASNTLSVLPRSATALDFVFDRAALVRYRASVLDAFTDLAAGFLQYAKDALCEQFLIKPPPRPGEHPVRLGVVSIRDNQVYKVCNFAGRRYVKSFPTVGYWLSVLPIQPYVAMAFRWLACLVLPERARKISTPQGEPSGGDMFTPASLLELISTIQSFDLGSLTREIGGKLDLTRRTAALALRSVQPAVPPPGGVATPVSGIIAQPVAQVAEMLQDRGLIVRRAAFDPRLDVGGAASVTGLFRTMRPGQEVTLCEQDGVVRFFSVSDPSPLTGRVADLEATVAARDREVETLRAMVTAGQRLLADATDLTAQITSARDELDRRDRAIAELQRRLDVLERGGEQ